MKRFKIKSTLQRGDSGVEVNDLYIFLQELGYLPGEPMRSLYRGFHKVPPAPVGVMKYGGELEAALAEYQRFHKLRETGNLDEQTLELISERRCAFPDIIRPEYVTIEAWDSRDVTYHFNPSIFQLKEHTGTLIPRKVIRNAFRIAFRAWQEASQDKLRITEAADAGDIEIRSYDYGTGSQFGGTYPPQDGDMYMDIDSDWSRDKPASSLDLFSAVLHEAGHAVGLDHVDDKACIMYPSIDLQQIKPLAQDDIDGVRALYP